MNKNDDIDLIPLHPDIRSDDIMLNVKFYAVDFSFNSFVRVNDVNEHKELMNKIFKQDEVPWTSLYSGDYHCSNESKNLNCCCNDNSRKNINIRKTKSSYRNLMRKNILVTIFLISFVNILSLIQSPRNIRHLPCVARKTGLKGTCMFAIDCLKSNGTHLGTCIDKFYFGSCCQLHAPEDAIFQNDISDNSIDNSLVSHFQHYSSGKRPLIPVSTIPAPSTNFNRRNVTASIQRVTTPSTMTTKKKYQQQNGIRVTTENIKLSTFQVVEEARVTSPSPSSNKLSSSSKVTTKPTKAASKAPIKVSSSSTAKLTTTAPVTTKFIQKKPVSTTSTTPSSTIHRRQNTTATKPSNEKLTTMKLPPSSVSILQSSTFAPLNKKTTTIKITTASKDTLPPKTTVYKTTTYTKRPIITGSTLHPVTMPYRNLTNRNPTKQPTPKPLTTNVSRNDSKPIYINITQGTKAPRPKPKPTEEITIVPPTSLHHLVENLEFSTIQYVSSSRDTTTTKPYTTTTLSDLVKNSTSYVTNTSFRPTHRPMSNSTQPQKFTQKPTSVTPSIKTTTQLNTTPLNEINSTLSTERPTNKITKPFVITTFKQEAVRVTTSKTTTKTSTLSTTKVPQTTTKIFPSTNARINSTSYKLTTPKPAATVSTTKSKPSVVTSSSRPISKPEDVDAALNKPLTTTEKNNLITWTIPSADSDQNNTDLKPTNWVLISTTPSDNSTTTISSTKPIQSTTSKRPIQSTSTSKRPTQSTTTSKRTTQSTTTTKPPMQSLPSTTLKTTSKPKTTKRTTQKSTITTTRTTPKSTTTTQRTTQKSTTSTQRTTQKITTSNTEKPTNNKKPPIIDDTGIPVLLIPLEQSGAPSTSGPPAYSTEEIIGTSTSTSIEVKPPQTTEPSIASSNVYVQNISMSSLADVITEPSNFEYNTTFTTRPPPFSSNVTHGSDFFTTTPAMPQLDGVDYKQICGKRMFPEPRIVGGAKASFGRWPWQISLRQWRTSTYLHKCGAALLNENWAITAAHCVDNVPPSDLLLRLGEYDLAVEEEPYGYQERRVQIVASHPQFDPRTFEYDLALLRFYEPVIFQPNIIPVCVPDSDEDFIGRTAYVTGWGRLYEDGPLPSVLQEVTVPVIKNDICEGMYRAAGYIEHIPHIFICAGWKKGGYDSCEGDSGGPMVIQRHDKRFQLAGVISWGIGCAEPNQPGVYTRISEFRDWINQILQF
uniref:CSON005463 protein n=1 Tax=Culicoides sonorensis TaxID=179676 RepID=A0A336M734_CULSO